MCLTLEKHDQDDTFPVTVFHFIRDICGRMLLHSGLSFPFSNKCGI